MLPLKFGRRSSSLTAVVACLLFLFTTVAGASSAVLGLDFGTLNLKAALVKPGIPLEIVLSKDSKRKETAAVGFKPNRDAKNQVLATIGLFPERVYGGGALALHGRLPGEVFPNLKPLLGVTSETESQDVLATYASRYPAVQSAAEQEQGTIVIKSNAFVESEGSWSVEELLAMEFSNIRKNAEALAKSVVEDVVITIPAFYTADERTAIELAANLAGLNVNALITDGLAVGLDYAKSRTFPEVTASGKPEYHIVYDMGAGSTTATVLRFQSRSVKDVGRLNKTVQEVAVVGAGWDRNLGGDALNDVILNEYLRTFAEKPDVKALGKTLQDLRNDGRLMSRLWSTVEKARQVLSANTQTSSSFEEILPDINFRTKITRAEFEKLAASFSDRVERPLVDALASAKLNIDDIGSVILHGGAIRTPFVQKHLEKFAGKSKLKTNVNSDESAVFGAAFRAAGMSRSFKVKEIRSSDVAAYPAGIKYVENGKDRRQGLFTPVSTVGNGATTKQVTFQNKDDFSFSFYQVVADIDRPTAEIVTKNLTDSVKELHTKFGCEKDQISTKFAIRLSANNGLPEVVSGSVSCEVDGSVSKSGSVGDSVKDWFGLGKKKDQEPLADGEEAGPTEEVKATTSSSSSSSAGKSSAAKSSSSKVPEKPKKRTESISVSFDLIKPAHAVSSSKTNIKRMADRLAAFDRSDRARVAREEAVNVLEGYTYHVREFLDNDVYSTFFTTAQGADITDLLAKTREFMESSEFVTATESVLREKYEALKSLITPIKLRKEEGSTRKTKLDALQSSMDQMKKLMQNVKEQIAEASASALKASEAAASESASASDSSAAPSDDLADLEEPDATSSSKAPPEPTAFTGLSAYTEDDFTTLNEAYEAVSKWMEEKQTAQDKLEPHDDPVLFVKDIEAQAAKLAQAMTDMIYKKMRFPTSSKSSKKPKSSRTKAAKKGKSSAASSSSSTTPPAEKSATEEGKSAFFTVRDGDEMPSEEEILERISQGKAKAKPTHAEL